MTDRIQLGSLQVSTLLHNFVNQQALPGTGVEPAAFWAGLEQIVNELAPRNRELLAKRDALQAKIDAWHVANKGQFDFIGWAITLFSNNNFSSAFIWTILIVNFITINKDNQIGVLFDRA